jgi:hypothetical protein
MKKLFLALFVLTSSVAFCQTTDDEYNYLTKGYAVQVSSGLDMKSGYTMTDKGSTPIDLGTTISVNTKYLYRTNGNVYAGALLIVNGMKGPSKYFCVPAPGSSMTQWNNTLTAIQTAFGTDKAGYEAVMWALMHILPN